MAEKALFQSGKRKDGGLLPKIGDVGLFLLLLVLDGYLLMNFVSFFESNNMLTTFIYVLLLPILIIAHLGNYFLFLSRKNNNFVLSEKYLRLIHHMGEEEKIDNASITGITVTNALRSTSFVIFNFDKRREIFIIEKKEKDALANAIIKARFDEFERLGVLGQKSYKSRTQAE